VVVDVRPPILDLHLSPSDWRVEVWVDGRNIANEIDSTSKPLERQFCIWQMPFKRGKKRMRGRLAFAKLVGIVPTRLGNVTD
jgi:hypothetical protein